MALEIWQQRRGGTSLGALSCWSTLSWRTTDGVDKLQGRCVCQCASSRICHQSSVSTDSIESWGKLGECGTWGEWKRRTDEESGRECEPRCTGVCSRMVELNFVFSREHLFHSGDFGHLSRRCCAGIVGGSRRSHKSDGLCISDWSQPVSRLPATAATDAAIQKLIINEPSRLVIFAIAPCCGSTHPSRLPPICRLCLCLSCSCSCSLSLSLALVCYRLLPLCPLCCVSGRGATTKFLPYHSHNTRKYFNRGRCSQAPSSLPLPLLSCSLGRVDVDAVVVVVPL